MSETARLTLEPKTMETAEPRAQAAMEAARKGLGFIPNMYANMANAPGLLETYLSGYKLFRAESGFTPPEQEVVFLTISRDNGCDYCLAAHTMIAEKVSHVPGAVLDAMRREAELPDTRLQALSLFTHIMVESRGRPNPAELAAFLAAGYSERHALEVVLAIAVKTISNYSNHVFHTGIDPAFAGYGWGSATK
jgi:AhpD family alkylhydroperoxidase